MDIFCPNNHLMLSSQICPKCGWKRQVEGAVGTLYWPPIVFNTPLGGVSRSSLTSFASLDDLLVLSTQNNELTGVSLKKGEILWRGALPKGQRATNILVHNEDFYVTIQDTHSLMEGIKGGYIGRINQKDGGLESLWTTTSHDLTPPVFIDDQIFFRTAESRVLSLGSFIDDNPIWEHECQSWWPAPLRCYGDYIVYADGNPMLEETELIARKKDTGDVSWVYTLPARPSQHLVGDDRFIYVVINNKSIVVLDTKTGAKVNEMSLPKIYCQPVLAGTLLYYTARGSKTDPDGYYQLHVVDTEKLDLKYKKDLGIKVQVPPLIMEDSIYLADYNSNIRALSTSDGKDLWSLENAEEDVILTTLHHANDQLFYGTYLGKLYSVTIRQPKESPVDVNALLEAEDFVSAAAVYALAGEFEKAAQLYISPIKDIDKAMRLYEEGNLCKKAADLAFENKRFSKALEYYRNAGDAVGEANTLLAMGDIEEAAKLFYNQGDILKAATLMEQAGKLSAASQMYKEAGRTVDYNRLITKTIINPSEVEDLRRQKNFEVAADWEMQNKQYLEAAKDYREAKNREKELYAFKIYLEQPESQPEQWVWQRMAEIGTQLSDHLVAASAWVRLDRWGQAGFAYQKYAEQLAAEIPDTPDGFTTPAHLDVAKYFQMAVDAFREEGIADYESYCKEMVRKFQQLPKVVVLLVETAAGLREMEWNNLTLTIKNIGHGRARNIRFSLDEERFEVQERGVFHEFNLATGLTRPQSIHIKPHRDEYGDSVPLQINWSWSDNTGKEYHDGGSISVPVARQREELASQSFTYTFQDIHGDWVTQKGDNVNVITNVGSAPQQVAQISSGREGDEIHTESETPTEIFDRPMKLCVNCKSPIDLNAKFCISCGAEQLPS